MITIKTEEEIEILREGGRRLAAIVEDLVSRVAPGVLLSELDRLALHLAREKGDTPSFLNYQPDGASRPYPASTCISINEEVVHGIPTERERVVKEGDIVSVDMGLIHKEMFTDMAITVGVGAIDEKARELIDVTRKALLEGIRAARGGAHVGDIGHAIESFVHPYGYGHAEGLAGHGLGYKVHEEPYVPNTGKAGQGPLLRPGMIIAIEPMLTEGSGKVKFLPDGYTVVTADGMRSAHYEHTILITEGEAEILTKM